MRTLPVVLTGALAGSLGLLAEAQQKPAFERAPDALERVTWRTRTLVSDDRLTNWNFAIPGAGLSFLETVVRADAAIVTFVEASSTQRVVAGGSRTFDSTLTAEEIASIKSRMGEVRLLTYRVERAGSRESIEKALRVCQGHGSRDRRRAGGHIAGWPGGDCRSGGRQRGRHGGQRPAGRAAESAGREGQTDWRRHRHRPVGAGRRVAGRRSRAGERAAAVPQAARPFRARPGRPQRAPRPGHRRSERVVPGNGAAPDQARLDDARHHRRRQRSRRSVQGDRRVRSRRAAGVRDQLHGLLEDASDPVGRRDAGEGRDAESRDAAQGRRRGAREDRRGDSEAGLRGAEEARASCSSSRACTACRTTRFRTPT